MKEVYKEKFKSKTKEELFTIICNQDNYQNSAVEAALEVLEIHYDVKDVSHLNPENYKVKPPKVTYQKRNKHPYFRTFSSREVWSSLSNAAMIVCIMWLSAEIPLDKMNEWIAVMLLLSVFVLIHILNHVFYKIEHKRSNQLLGGFIQMGMTSTWLFLFMVVRSVHLQIDLDFELSIVIFFIMIFLAFVIEVFTQLVRYILTKLKWQAW